MRRSAIWRRSVASATTNDHDGEMTMSLDTSRIGSVGLPPERHADRVIGEMLREISRVTAELLPNIRAIVASSSDGNPVAQRKLEARLQASGCAGNDTEAWQARTISASDILPGRVGTRPRIRSSSRGHSSTETLARELPSPNSQRGARPREGGVGGNAEPVDQSP